MGNMSYCRFENTEKDLADCQENMSDVEEISSPEAKARKRIIQMCMEIAADYGHELEGECCTAPRNLESELDAQEPKGEK